MGDDLSQTTLTSCTADEVDSDRRNDGGISMSTFIDAWKAAKQTEQAAQKARDTFDTLSNEEEYMSETDKRLDNLRKAYASASTQLTNAIDERIKTMNKLTAVDDLIVQTKSLLAGINNTINELHSLRNELIVKEKDTEQPPQQLTVVDESNDKVELHLDTLIRDYVPNNSIGITPLVYESRSFTGMQMSISYYSSYAEFVRMGGRLAVLNKQFIKQGDVSAEQIEKDLKLGRHYLVERSTMSKVMQSHFGKISSSFEKHINAPVTNKDQNYKGLYQGITWECTNNLWIWLSNEDWVVELVAREGPINVIDAGSGLNSPCINATYTLGGMIKVAIGIEGDQHKARVAAQCSKSLCKFGLSSSASFGMYYYDFASIELNYRGVHFILFWDRAFTDISCKAFYQQLYNSIEHEVLLAHSTAWLRKRKPMMTKLFTVEEAASTFQIKMKGGHTDTIKLFKLTKKKGFSTVDQATLDEPLVRKALVDFSLSNREKTYDRIISSTDMPRLRSHNTLATNDTLELGSKSKEKPPRKVKATKASARVKTKRATSRKRKSRYISP